MQVLPFVVARKSTVPIGSSIWTQVMVPVEALLFPQAGPHGTLPAMKYICASGAESNK